MINLLIINILQTVLILSASAKEFIMVIWVIFAIIAVLRVFDKIMEKMKLSDAPQSIKSRQGIVRHT